LIDHSTRGARQGNIKHAPRIRPIALSEFWIHLRQRTILQTGHWDPILSKSGRGSGQDFSFCLWALLWPFFFNH
jgi:hypothetical protein